MAKVPATHKISLFSIAPACYEFLGHFYEYFRSIEKAATINGWRSFTFTPDKCTISPLPRGWLKVLPIRNLRLTYLHWMYSFFVYFIFFSAFFKKLRRRNSCAVLLEQHGVPFLVAITFAAFIFRPRCQLWGIVRFSLDQFRGGHIMSYCFKILKMINNNAHIVTDSTFLAQEIAEKWREEAVVLPIPHTHFRKAPTKKQKIPYRCCWLGAPRKDKGLDKIVELAITLSSDSPICLVVAETFPPVGYVERITLNLTREAYEEQLLNADFVLLPYDPSIYHARTSGVFVEAVVAGKIPILRKGTWMAKEADRYGLNKLIIEWQTPAEVVSKLIDIAKDQPTLDKLALMQADYCKFHSADNTAKILHTLYSKT